MNLEQLLQSLNEKRDAALQAAETLTITAATETRGLSDDEQTTFNQHIADADALEVRIAEVRTLVEKQAAGAELRKALPHVHVSGKETSDDNVDEIRSFIAGETRALVISNTATEGTNWRPDTPVAKLVEARDAVQVIGSLASTIYTPNADTIWLPSVTKQMGDADATLDGANSTADDPELDRITFGVHKISRLVEAGEELNLASGVDILSFLLTQLGRSVGRAEAAAFATGTAPQGLFTGLTASATITDDVTYLRLVDQMAALPAQYLPGARWVMSPLTWASILKLVDGQGRPLVGTVQSGAAKELLGFPVSLDGYAPANKVVFGDIATAYTVRRVANTILTRSEDPRNGNTIIRTASMFDAKVVFDESVVLVDYTPIP